jgi:hypothetical protein
MKDGLRDGQGKLIFISGIYYEGQFKEGKYHGNGLFRHEDGSNYKG